MSRKIITFCILLCITSVLSSAYAESRMKVTFINPSRMGYPFWDTTVDVMRAAAEDLNVDLKVVYASTPEGTNRFKYIELAKAEAALEDKPDYIITLFRKSMAKTLLDITEKAGIKTFIFNTNVDESEKDVIGLPREKYQSWIGHMYPDDVDAGYVMTEYLIKRAEKEKLQGTNGKVNILALSGNRHSIGAVSRNIGLKQAIGDHDQYLHRILFAEWKADTANKIVGTFLKRSPEISILWSANDDMVLGAMDTIHSYEPRILTGGMDWTQAGLKSIQEGKLTVSLGGAFFRSRMGHGDVT